MTLPQSVLTLLRQLNSHGFEAFVVGGGVRDALMGKQPHDYDLTTSATPEETEFCFSGFRVIETGIQHGTVTVLINGEPVEITTYRVDGEYEDHRHPKQVCFTRSLREDLARRDFTINAMAYHPALGIQDPFGGQRDLLAKRIVCVGDPDKRFQEDGLRILRALRFASVLDFSIETKTAAAILHNRALLKSISAERIAVEWKKLLNGVAVASVLLRFAEVFRLLFPGWEPEERALSALSLLGSPEERMTAFLSPLTPDSAAQALPRLRLDKATCQTVTQLCRLLCAPLPDTPAEIRRLTGQLGYPQMKRLLRLCGAFQPAQAENVRAVEAIVRLCEQTDACLTLRQLAISGDTLRQLGCPAGKAVGTLLQALLDAVLQEQLPNEPQALQAAAVRLCNRNAEQQSGPSD